MRTIYAEYNINHDSIDVYTSAGYTIAIAHTNDLPVPMVAGQCPKKPSETGCFTVFARLFIGKISV